MAKYDGRRESSAQRGYGYKWQKARDAYLTKHPLCVRHEELGKVVAATVVDHKVPHKGDMKLFWDHDNWQSLCDECHNGYKQRLEKSERVVGCDVDGVPIDPGHHWRRGGGG